MPTPTPIRSSRKKVELVKLAGAENYSRLHSSVQVHMFRVVYNTRMDALQRTDTLDPIYFASDPFTSVNADALRAAAQGNKLESKDFLLHPESDQMCFKHSITTGHDFVSLLWQALGKRIVQPHTLHGREVVQLSSKLIE